LRFSNDARSLGESEDDANVILRLSPRLASKIKSGTLQQIDQHENHLLDWSCRLFVAQRTEFILISNTASMFSCVFPSVEVADCDRLVDRMLVALRVLMFDNEQEANFHELAKVSAVGVTIARSRDRSLAMSMNDHVHSTKLYLADGLNTDEVGQRLNNTRMAILTPSRRRHFVMPKDVFIDLSRSRL